VGWIGRHRLEAVAASGAADIVLVADADEERAARVCESVGTAGACDVEALLRADLDGVVIATPNALHAVQCRAAFARGLAVFCQKPLARTAAETREIVAAAERADRRLGVDLSYRTTRAMQRVRALVASGGIGPVFAVDLVFHNAYGPDKAWFYDRALSGGGCVMDLGVHLVDLALWTLDFPGIRDVSSRLYAGGRRLAPREDAVEDFAVAELSTDAGATVRLACSWRIAAGVPAVIEATFYGTRGAARFRNVEGSFYDFVAEHAVGTSRETLESPPDEWGGRAAVDWARALGAGARFDPEARRYVDVAEVLERIYGR
jgi:predicted dehydrogenase